MPRATTKEELINNAKENYEKLNLLISKLNEEELITEIARIIGGDITEYSIMNAKELRNEKKAV